MLTQASVCTRMHVQEGFAEGVLAENVLLFSGSFIPMAAQIWFDGRFWTSLTKCCMASKECASERKSC